MANKSTYGQRGRELAAKFLEIAADVAAWRNTYFDRGYDSGGSDPIVDADVEAFYITESDVTGLITAADALDTYLAANRAYYSRMRSDL